LNDGPLE